MNLRILILEDNTADSALMELELRQTGIAFDSKRVETRGGGLRLERPAASIGTSRANSDGNQTGKD